MAKRVESVEVGVDVAKDELVIVRSDLRSVEALPNTRSAIRRWLKALPAGSIIGIESTGTYHLAFAEEAHKRGHTIYMIDGYRLNRYREGTGGRAKTDATDAALLVRYVQKERDELKPWVPPSRTYQRVHQLLQRRARLVEAQQKISQSLKGVPELAASAKSLKNRINQVIQLIERRLAQAVAEAGWRDNVQRCDAIEGVGELTATALVKAFNRGEFTSTDAFIAFLGLDVRVRDSGKMRGQRKLTKKGNSEIRRLLHNAAMAASRSKTWAPVYQRYLARGLKRTQALVALARKLARVAFALMRNGTTYQPKTPVEACVAT